MIFGYLMAFGGGGGGNRKLIIGVAVIVVLAIVIIAALELLGHGGASTPTGPAGAAPGSPLSVSVSPPSDIVNATSVVTLTAFVTGGLQPYYLQWYNDTGSSPKPIVGQTGSTLYINTSASGTYRYYVSVSDSEATAKTVASSPVSVLVVVPSLTASVSPQQPSSYISQTVTLTATASYGVPPYKYQWYNDTTGTGVPISGQTRQTLSINTTAAGTYAYYVSVSDSETPAKTAYSSPVKLTVNSAPVIAVSISNNQNVGTGSDFQQMIAFNPSQYSAYEAQNLGNIRFYQGSTELYSWCESGCSSKSHNVIFWIKLPNGIAPYSSAGVNMIFESQSTNYDGVYAGESPQLSPTYAQYDNGADVFYIYTNFTGTSLSQNWINTNQSEGSTAVATVNDGLTYNSTPGNGGSLSYGIQINPQKYVFETYTEFTSQVEGTSGGWPEILLGTTGTANYNRVPSIEIAMGGCSTLNNIDLTSIGGPNDGNGGFSSFPAALNTYYVTSLYETPTAGYGALNYTPLGNTNGYASCNYLGGPYFTPQTLASMSYWAVNGAGLKSLWMRARLIPPNGVMPSASFSPST